jgi:glycosyltransferase involved in cell wall biosynthesis
VILLPHKQRYGSASGVFHQAIGGQRPVLVARGPKFVDAQKVLSGLPELTVPPASVRAWSKAMLRVIEDPALRERARAAVVDYARRTSWADVSREHYRVYLGLRDGTNP